MRSNVLKQSIASVMFAAVAVTSCLASADQIDSDGFLRDNNGELVSASQKQIHGLDYGSNHEIIKVGPGLCQKFGSRMFTARELAQRAVKQGAEMAEIKDFYPSQPSASSGFDKIVVEDEDGTFDSFYFKMSGYTRLPGEKYFAIDSGSADMWGAWFPVGSKVPQPRWRSGCYKYFSNAPSKSGELHGFAGICYGDLDAQSSVQCVPKTETSPN